MRKPVFSLLMTLLLLLASATGINAQSSDTLLFENFNASSLPSGWDTCRWVPGSSVTASTPAATLANYRWKSLAGGVSNTRCAYLYALQSYTLQHGIMTPARTFSSTDPYKVCFDLKNSSTSTNPGGVMDVYVTLDNGVTIIDTLAMGINSGSSFIHYEYDIPKSKVGGQNNVRILFLGKSSHYYYLDNVVICKASQCKSAVDIVINDLTTTSADISWDVNQNDPSGNKQSPTRFELKLFQKSDMSQLLDTMLSVTAFSFTSLTPGTEYVIKIYSDCGSSGQGDPATYEFKTFSSMASLPYYVDFENGIPSECFTSGAVSNTAAVGVRYGSGSMKITTEDAAGFFTPLLNANADSIEIAFWIKPSVAGKQIKLGYSTNPYNDGYFTILSTYSTENANQWKEIRFNTRNIASQQGNIMLGFLIDGGSGLTLYVDSIHVHAIPSCTRPENLVVTGKTYNSVSLSWNMSSAQNHRIMAIKAGNDTAFNQVVAATNSYVLTGLESNTRYSISVAAVCSATDESDANVLTDSVHTFCAIADNAEMFDGAEDAAVNNLPDCWTTGVITEGTGTGNVYTDFPFYVATAAKHTGSKGFQLRNMRAGTVSFLSSQQRNFGNSGDYTLRLWVNRSASTKLNEGIDIWVTPNPGDTTGGSHIQMINRYYAAAPVEAAAGWYRYEYPLNYSGNGYLTFIGKSQYGSYTYFDDIEIIETPRCAHIDSLRANNITSSSIDLSWVAGGTETQWQLGYKVTTGGATVVADTVVATSTAFTITGLQPSTSYVLNAFVRAICGTDTAEAEVITNYTFKTACLAINTLPYTMGFEADETFLDFSTTFYYPNCWSRYNDYTGSSSSYFHYPYASTTATYARTGARGLYSYISSTTAPNSIMILPDVDTALYDISNLRVKFYAKQSTATSSLFLYLGVMADITDFSTFTVVDTVYISGDVWTSYEMDLSRYTGNGTHIGLNFSRAGASGASYTYLDDLVLDLIPSCADLQGSVAISGLTDNSCKVTLADTTAAASWQYAVGPQGAEPSMLTPVDVTTDTFTLTGLTPATRYVIYARRNCGSGDFGAWTDSVAFATTAVPATIPYVCGFEDNAENAMWMTTTKASQYYDFTIGTDTAGVYDGQKALYVTNSTGAYTYSVTATSSAGRAFAYRTIHFDAKGYQINLKWKATGGQTFYDYGRIILTDPATELNLTNQNATTTITPNFKIEAQIDTGIYYTSGTATYRALNCSTYQSCNPDARGWCSMSYFLDMTNRPGNYNLVIMWNQNATTGNATYPIAVDHISIEELNCIPATNVVITPATTSAGITIQQPAVVGWEVIVDDEPINVDSITDTKQYIYRQQTTTNVVTVTGLDANTRYYYTLRTLCHGSEISDWREVDYFETNCEMVTIPYTEGFESVTSANCWKSLSSSATASLGRSTEQFKSGDASLKVVSTPVVSPELNVDSLTLYQLTGFVYSTVDTLNIAAKVGTDPTDVSQFSTAVFTEQIFSKNKWREFTVYFDSLSYPQFSDFKDSRYILLDCGSSATAYFDDIEVKLAPACRKPGNVVVSNVGSNQLDISFSDNSGASQWVVRCNDRLDTISSTSATITGLTGSTDYTVSVAALCSSTSASDFAEAGSFTTPCDGRELPWSCGFEIAEGWTNTSFVAGEAEANCFNTLNLKADGKTYPYFYSYASTTAANTGTKGIYAYNSSAATSSTSDGYFILPAFEAPANKLRIEYMAKNSGTTATYPDIEFGYMTDINDQSSFVLLVTHPKTTTFTKRTYLTNDTTDGIPANARFAFRIQRKSGGYYIDDINVTEIRSCSDPMAAVASNITDSSAMFLVSDANQTHTAWEYICVPAGASTKSATPAAVPADRNVTVTGLDAFTQYTFYVRAVCGVGDVSNWVATDFTTACLPFEVTETNPFFEGFEDYSYGEYISKRANSDCYSIVEGTSDSYRFKMYPTTTPSATATTIYFYAHDSLNTAKCAYLYGGNTYTPNGAKIMRDFRLQAGKTYVASAFVRAGTTNTSRFDMLLSDGTTVDTLATKFMNGASAIPVQYQGKSTYRYDLMYEEIRSFFTVPANGVYDLGIKLSNGSTTGGTVYYMFLDDWSVREFDGCIPQTAVLDSVAADSAFFTIDDTIAGHTWEYLLNDTVAGTPVATGSRNIVLTGLQHSTSYTLYLRTYCSATNHSEWIAVPFVSACAPVASYPYTQGFENEFLPNCWTQFYTNNGTVTTANYWTQYTSTTASYVHSGIRTAQLSYKANTNTALVTGAFDLSTNPYGYTVSFWIYRYSSTTTYANDMLRLLVSDQPITAQNVAAATEIGSVHKYIQSDPVEETAGLHQYEFDVPSQFLGGNAYFAFYHTVTTGASALYIDDIAITEIPACRDPKKAPTLVGTTKHTATVTFNMEGKDSVMIGWAPYVNGVTAGDITDSLVTVTETTTVSGLDSLTNYILFARYLCDSVTRSAWSPALRFRTKSTDCFNPSDIHTVGMVDNAHATLTWVGAPDAFGYEYELKRNNVTVASGTTVAPVTTVSFDSLVALTAYAFSVRGLCIDDTTSWVTASFSTTAVPQSMPYVTDFENPSRDSEWMFVTPSGIAPNHFMIGSDASAAGSRSMYVTNDDVNNQYQIASEGGVASTSFSYAQVLLPFTAGNYMFSYNWRCYGEGFTGASALDFGRIFLAPAGTTIPTLTYSLLYGDLSSIPGAVYVSNNILNNSASWTSNADIVNIAEDKMYYLVVAWANDASVGNQPPFAIDNISVQPVSCLPVQGAEALTVTDRDAAFAVTRRAGAAGTTLHYAVSEYATADSIHSYSTLVPASASSMVDTVSVSGLTGLSQYYFHVRAVCDSANLSPWVSIPFKTSRSPMPLPYVCSFDSVSDTTAWRFANSQYSWFVIGSDISKSASNSLYITDNGSAYRYTSPGTPTSANGTSYAYIPLSFGPSTYEVEFDWLAMGVSTLDYGRAFLAPTSDELLGDVLNTGLSYNTVPAGWIALDGTKLNLASDWQHRYAEVSFTDSVAMNLVFVWRQNYITDTQGPLAIDNISVREQTCIPVAGVTYSATTTTARLKARHANENAQIFWHVASDNTYSDTVAMAVTDSVLNLTGLTPATRYYFKVATVCNGNDTAHAKSYYFRSACDTVRDFPYFEGFESYASGFADTLWHQSACWNVVRTTTSAYSYPSNTATYVRSGNNGLYVYNTATTGTQQYLAMPVMNDLNGKTISFWHKASSTTASYAVLSFGYTTTGTNFVPLQTFTNKVTDWSEHTQVLNNLPAGARLVFKFDGTYYYYIDDIRINDIISTPAVYNDTICFNAPYNNHGISFDAGALHPGDTTISKVVRSVTPGVADSTLVVNIHVRREIATVAYDTICANTPVYIWGNDTILNPTGTATHTQRFIAPSCGCDSTVSLDLTVLPESVDINRTICQGDSLVIGDTALYYQGFYVLYYQTAQGCTITANVNLVVEDSVQVTPAAICEGSTYPFMGGTYSQPGIYRVNTTSAAGCPVVKELHLTVYPTDSVINETFCRGGSITLAGEVITHDTTFVKILVNPGVECSTTYYVTATTDAPVPAQVSDNACEGYLYSGFGLVDLLVTHDTVCYVNTRTSDGLCDSVTAITLKYNSTAYGSETAVMPESGSYTWHDRTFNKPGTYTDTMLRQSAAGCDSIVTLTLTGGTGFDYVASVDVRIVPNPLTAGNTAFVYVDAEVASVEILNSFGQVVDTFAPAGYPIEVSGISASGIYYVRLTLSDGNVIVQKLIVK